MKRVLTFGLTLLVAGIAVSLLAAAPTQRKFSPHQEPRASGTSSSAAIASSSSTTPASRAPRARFSSATIAGVPSCGWCSMPSVGPSSTLSGARARTADSRPPPVLLRRPARSPEASLGESPGERHDLGSRPRAPEGRRSRHPSLRRDPGAGRGRRACQGGPGGLADPAARPEGRPAVVPRRLRSLDLAPRQLQRPHAGLERRRSEHDRPLGASSRPDGGQRRGFRAERVAVRHTRRGPRAQLPHRLEPPQPDGAHHVDGAAGRRLLRRLAVLHDRDEQRPAAWPRWNAARARGHVRTPGRPVRLDAGRDTPGAARSRCGSRSAGQTGRISRSVTGSAWSPRPTRPRQTGRFRRSVLQS